jgi:hypothetical protein
MSKDMLKDSTGNYRPVMAEISKAADENRPGELAVKLAAIIKADTAFDKAFSGIQASQFIRAILEKFIPGSAKVDAKKDPVRYCFYANIRRLTKKALGYKAQKTPAQKTGLERLLASVAKVETAKDCEAVIDAATARKTALTTAEG